ncbi:MAG: methionine gamma-lyase [Methylocystaceae bacterium]|nr:methionine gamma-lyase [Methylocystaceae bacterium]
MTTSSKSGFATRAIHFGYDPQEEKGALTPPLHMTSTFCFETAEAGGEMFAGEREGYFYSRVSNPTLDLLERRLASLEEGGAALATASGMGAITALLWTLLKSGDEIVVDKTLYGCTFAFMRHGLSRFGVNVIHADLTDPQNLTEVLSDKTRVVYFETPANPNMRLVDIAAICEIAHKKDVQVVVDNTYATPYLCRPLTLGADFVVHSATKYLGGHGDLVAGCVVGRSEDMMNVRLLGLKDMTGAVLSPMNAMLVMRGLKTLALRMDRHCENAMHIARMLEDHPAVSKVSYPGLESFAQYDLAQQQMDKPGGMIAFEVHGGFEGGIAMMNGLKMIQRAVSLGDTESLIQHPASMTHSAYTAEERAEYLISDGLIRLSVGLEDVCDIEEDLLQALNKGMKTHNMAAE